MELGRDVLDQQVIDRHDRQMGKVDGRVDVDAERSPALHWERWVRDHLIRRIPGA